MFSNTPVLITLAEFDNSYMVWIWLSIFIICVIIEAASVDLVSIFFAGGALLALILSLIPNVPFWAEIIVFVLGSAAMLFALRPLLKKIFKNVPHDDSNIDGMIGKKGKVIKDISELERGEVKCNGVIWTAINKKKEENISSGAIVKIVGIEGNKLIVEKIEEPKKGE